MAREPDEAYRIVEITRRIYVGELNPDPPNLEIPPEWPRVKQR